MNSELTRNYIEQLILIEVEPHEISSSTLKSLLALALRALDMEQRPIAEAPKDERFIYAFHTIWKCWIAIKWDGEFWFEKTKTTRWPDDAFDCYVPFRALPTPKDE